MVMRFLVPFLVASGLHPVASATVAEGASLAPPAILEALPSALRDKWRRSTHNITVDGRLKINLVSWTRFIDVIPGEVPIAELQVYSLRRDATLTGSPQQVAEKVAAQLSTLVKTPFLLTRTAGKVYVAETVSRQINRYVRAFVEVSGEKVTVSVANIRPVYLFPTSLEIELLQRRMHSSLNQNQKFGGLLPDWQGEKRVPAGFDLTTWLVPSATAQAIPDVDLDQLLDRLIGDLKGLGLDEDRIRRQLDEYLAKPKDWADDFTSGRDTIKRELRDTRDGVFKRVDRFNDEIKASRESAEKIAADVQRTAKEISAETNQTLRDVTDQLTSFETAFKVGFGGALGAIAAGAVVNLVRTGVVGLAKAAYFGISGKIPPEILATMKEKALLAFQDLDEISKEMDAAQLEIDRNIAALTFITGTTAENVMATFYGERAKLDNAFRDLQKKVEKAKTPADYDECGSRRTTLENAKAVLDAIEPVLTGTRLREKAQLNEAICRQLESSLEAWKRAERRFPMARAAVVNNLTAVVSSMNKQAQAALKKSTGARSFRNNCLSSVKQSSKLKNGIKATDQTLPYLDLIDEDIEAQKNLCDEMTDVSYSRFNESESAALGVRALREQTEALKAHQEDLTNFTTFNQLVGRYNQYLEVARELCPEMNVLRLASIQQTVTSRAAAKTAAVAEAAAPAPKKGGFWRWLGFGGKSSTTAQSEPSTSSVSLQQDMNDFNQAYFGNFAGS